MILLQTPTVPPVNVNDSLKVHTEHFIEQMQTDPQGFVESLTHQAIMFGLKVLAALVIYFVGAWLIKRLVQVQKAWFRRRNTDATMASFLSSATSMSLTVLLLVITIGTLGINTTSLAAVLAAGGMAIGMALSGTVQNFAGGLMILAFKPFKVGDWISAQGFSGTVTAVSITSTKIRTIDNREVILPNGALSNGVIDNYSTLPIRRIDMTVSVAYGTDAMQCIDLLLSILRSEDKILDKTTQGADEPFVALKALNSSDISFAVRAFVKNEDFWDVTFRLNRRIYTELPQQGIQFAYPHMDVNIVNK